MSESDRPQAVSAVDCAAFPQAGASRLALAEAGRFAVPIRPCPHCQTPTAKHLEASSKDAWVNYYRCERCGHVWTVPKDAPFAPPKSVTREPDTREPETP